MQTSSWELRLLKALLWIYIGLCLAIASLNWGYVPSAPPKIALAITKLWHFYENWIKTLLIVVCSFLTLRIIHKKKMRTTMRKRNLAGFAIAALLIHILLPLLLQNPELYFFAMPLPWSTVPLQAGIEGTAMHQGLTQSIGLGGVRASLLFFWIYTACIMVGTLLFGRRLQCSTLCLFNGFASEVFGAAIPLVGRFTPPFQREASPSPPSSERFFSSLPLVSPSTGLSSEQDKTKLSSQTLKPSSTSSLSFLWQCSSGLHLLEGSTATTAP